MADHTNKFKTKYNWLKNLVAIFVNIFFFAPFYIIIALSFKARGDRSSHWLFPKKPQLQAYVYAFKNGKIGLAIINTLIVTSFSVLLIVIFGSIASYPLARHRNRINRFILSAFVGVMMVPPLSVLVPIYKLMVRMGGINTYWGIILLTTTYGLPMSIFMFTNFISTIPKELDEAALLDGCSQFAIFHKIVLPNMLPVVSSVIILTGVSIYNDYSFQLYILQKPKLRTITLAMSSFFSERLSYLPAAAAAAVMAVLPVIILYLFLQKYFIKGTIDSAVK